MDITNEEIEYWAQIDAQHREEYDQINSWSSSDFSTEDETTIEPITNTTQESSKPTIIIISIALLVGCYIVW